MRLFAKKAYRACRHCANGRPTGDGERVLCVHKGIVEADYACRKYRYDPLKRVPKRRPALPAFSADEFKL